MIAPEIQAVEPAQKIAVDPPTAAEMLSISERTLWEYTKSGDIPSFKLGRLTRYAVAALEACVMEKSGRAGKIEG